ncbi:hypothetical protein CWC19_21100 [Pseudoalteromonas aurantia]|uniref:Uncharacterized protein n=1 Tax=Pseudoalteromonas aurantia TaxID=43654 RepID=A0A5S3UW33_9GAMM|nr:hypothetical protein CWC19_21100 [Pseudoalteromonas aurantia]
MDPEMNAGRRSFDYANLIAYEYLILQRSQGLTCSVKFSSDEYSVIKLLFRTSIWLSQVKAVFVLEHFLSSRMY